MDRPVKPGGDNGMRSCRGGDDSGISSCRTIKAAALLTARKNL